MKKFILSITLILFVFMSQIVIFFHMNNNIYLYDEYRKQTPFPELPAKIYSENIKIFFHKMDAFLADRFPLRLIFIDFVAIFVAGILHDNLNFDRCFWGKENYVYLGNKDNRIVDKITGKITLQGENLQLSVNKYYNMHVACNTLNIQYVLFIGPNKATIYPEYLPDFIKPSPGRYITPLLEELVKRNVCVYDPTHDLLKAKEYGPLFLRADTHWNLLATSIAFGKFLEKMHLPPLPPHDVKPVPTWPADLLPIGKLGKIYVHPKDGCYGLSWHTPINIDVISTEEKRTSVQNDKFGPFPPGGVIYNAHATTEKIAWIFCDSFSQALYPYINATFKEVRYFQGRKPDWQEMVAKAENRPDIIMDIFTERSY